MTEAEKIKVLVVDDHPMVIAGMQAILQQIAFATLGATAANAYEAIQALKGNTEIQVAIVDINLPEVSGIDLTAKIRTEFPEVQVLAMSTFNQRSYIVQMLQQGAIGYLVKSASKEEIEEAILCAYEGRLYLGQHLAFSVADANAMEQQQPIITTREKEVLALIADGHTSPQIAAQLFISLHTVESHRKNLLLKFGVTNTASLIKQAAKWSLV
ncbi:MAG TPA: response regulator transcription factor [Phnomibacter sp.]|nr:response regulator transcription factor [Phnomibacter sp.]